jgi:hypothetical protein
VVIRRAIERSPAVHFRQTHPVPAGTELEREIDRLYELPLGEFTSARDEAVKRLRAAGRRDLADAVKQLRKPTVPVWLVNRLAHERGLDVQRLLKAGEALAKSQAGAAGGDAADTFAKARREEQHALERLADAARELAEHEDVGASSVERAIQTLRAASLTAEGRELLKRGRLTEELQPPGFDALTPGALPKRSPRPAKARKPKDDPRERRRAVKEARERVARLRAEERELAKAARAARREAERAESGAAAVRKRAEDAEAEVAGAADQRASAEAELERLE